MKYVGIDLHKQTISVCVVTKDRQVQIRKRFFTRETERIRDFFAGLGEFQMVVEATASYEWLFRLLEPLATRAVLAHPGKLRIIAESTRKSDRHDAQALAERLAEQSVPLSYRPTPRQRDHRRLVRQRIVIQRKITTVKNRLRRLLTDYNADVRNLFSAAGRAHFEQVPLSEADRLSQTLPATAANPPRSENPNHGPKTEHLTTSTLDRPSLIDASVRFGTVRDGCSTS